MMGCCGWKTTSLIEPRCPGSLYKMRRLSTSQTYTKLSAEPAATFKGATSTAAAAAERGPGPNAEKGEAACRKGRATPFRAPCYSTVACGGLRPTRMRRAATRVIHVDSTCRAGAFCRHLGGVARPAALEQRFLVVVLCAEEDLDAPVCRSVRLDIPASEGVVHRI